MNVSKYYICAGGYSIGDIIKMEQAVKFGLSRSNYKVVDKQGTMLTLVKN